MRRRKNIGWRSARAYGATQGAVPRDPDATAWVPAPATTAPGRVTQSAPVAYHDHPAQALPRWPWQGVHWSIAFVAFLFYWFCIVSYTYQLGREAELVAVAALALGLGDVLRTSGMWWLLASYFVLVALAYPITEFHTASWDPVIELAKIVVIALTALSVLRDRPRIRMFIFALLAFFGLYPVRGALFNTFIYGSSEQGRVSWRGIFGNANDLSTLLLLPLGLAAGLLFVERQRSLRYAAYLGCALIPLVIFLAQSRGAIIGLAAGAALVLGTAKRARVKTLLSLGVVGIVLALFAPKGVWQRLGNLNSAVVSGNLWSADDAGSAQQRFEIWGVAWAISKDHLAAGIGIGAYKRAHLKYVTGSSRFSRLAGGARDAHNTYLTVLAETGVLGFTLWIAMVVVVVRRGVHALSRMRQVVPREAMQLRLLLASLLAFGVASVFSTMGGVGFTYIHLVLVLVLAEQGLRDVQRLGSPVARSR